MKIGDRVRFKVRVSEKEYVITDTRAFTCDCEPRQEETLYRIAGYGHTSCNCGYEYPGLWYCDSAFNVVRVFNQSLINVL